MSPSPETASRIGRFEVAICDLPNNVHAHLDGARAVVFDAIRELMTPPEPKPTRKIGFV